MLQPQPYSTISTQFTIYNIYIAGLSAEGKFQVTEVVEELTDAFDGSDCSSYDIQRKSARVVDFDRSADNAKSLESEREGEHLFTCVHVTLSAARFPI